MSPRRLLSAAVRGAGRLVPRAVRDRAEQRLFYAVFQLTRVTNDNYGQRVDPASGGQGGGEAARPLRRG